MYSPLATISSADDVAMNSNGHRSVLKTALKINWSTLATSHSIDDPGSIANAPDKSRTNYLLGDLARDGAVEDLEWLNNA
jgi:hypothetical protein